MQFNQFVWNSTSPDSGVSHGKCSAQSQHRILVLLQALIDRPDTVRRVENFKRLTLTDFKLDIPKLAKKKDLKKSLEENGDVCSRIAHSVKGQRYVYTQHPCLLPLLQSDLGCIFLLASSKGPQTVALSQLSVCARGYTPVCTRCNGLGTHKH